MDASPNKLRVLSLTPGRVRLRLPGWTPGDEERIETGLCRVSGVESVTANPLTGNVLIFFDRSATDAQRLLDELQETWAGLDVSHHAERDEYIRLEPARVNSSAPDSIVRPVEGQGGPTSYVLRVGMRGVVGHAVVDSMWFGAGFLGSAFGLPLAGLGPLHVLMDILVWGIALMSASQWRGATGEGRGTPMTNDEAPITI